MSLDKFVNVIDNDLFHDSKPELRPTGVGCGAGPTPVGGPTSKTTPTAVAAAEVGSDSGGRGVEESSPKGQRVAKAKPAAINTRGGPTLHFVAPADCNLVGVVTFAAAKRVAGEVAKGVGGSDSDSDGRVIEETAPKKQRGSNSTRGVSTLHFVAHGACNTVGVVTVAAAKGPAEGPALGWGVDNHSDGEDSEGAAPKKQRGPNATRGGGPMLHFVPQAECTLVGPVQIDQGGGCRCCSALRVSPASDNRTSRGQRIGRTP